MLLAKVLIVVVASVSFAADSDHATVQEMLHAPIRIKPRQQNAKSSGAPKVQVKVVLTHRELEQLVDLQWQFMQTPEGKAMMERIAANMPNNVEKIWDEFFSKFEVWKDK